MDNKTENKKEENILGLTVPKINKIKRGPITPIIITKDDQGRTIREQCGSRVWEWKYDENGNLCYEKDPDGFESWIEFKNNLDVRQTDSAGRDTRKLYCLTESGWECVAQKWMDRDSGTWPVEKEWNYEEKRAMENGLKIIKSDAEGGAA